MSQKGGQSGFGIFVETFKQRDAHGVAQRVIVVVVAGGICVKIVVGPEFLALRGIGVGEAVARILVVESPDETRYRNVLTGYDRVGFVACFFPVADFVAVVHVELLSAHS